MTAAPALFLPAYPQGLTEAEVWRWFGNVREELRCLPLTESERELLQGYYAEVGLLREWRTAFFRRHFAEPLLMSVREIFRATRRPRVLDIGCGTGTQSLLFALLGAEVMAVDMEQTALDILRKRIDLYREASGRSVEIRIESANVFELELESMGPLDAVYSLFAFNMMQPTGDLLQRLEPHLKDQAVLAIQDGNRRHLYNRLFRPRAGVASRDELRTMLAAVGFNQVRQVGRCAIPPLLWRVVPPRVLERIDRRLARYEPFALSYLHLARRNH